MKHKVIENKGDNINIIINDNVYVPTLNNRLVFLKKLAQTFEDKWAGDHILGK